MSSSEEVEEELLAIDAILEGGFTTERDANGRASKIVIHCSPLVASMEERSYVGLTLEVAITPGYPNEEPALKIRFPRGLDENDVTSLKQQLLEACKQSAGLPVIYQLIDLCREFLTEKNVPACPCAICLHHIVGEDEFVKTVCYHYFHGRCFGRYLKSYADSPKEEQRTNFLCPVCRGPIPSLESADIEQLLAKKPPVLEPETEDFSVTREMKELQEKMSNLFTKQKAAGGIIDVEAEARKYLIITSSGDLETEENQPGPPVRPPPAPPKPANESSKKCKGGSGLGKKRDYGEKKRVTRRRN